MKMEYVNQQIGLKIKHYRNMLGMSQKYIADRCAISSQQIQKYEAGLNHISAYRLNQIADIMEMPIDLFFIGLPGHIPATKSNVLKSLGNSDILQLIKNYNDLTPTAKAAVLNLLNTLT